MGKLNPDRTFTGLIVGFLIAAGVLTALVAVDLSRDGDDAVSGAVSAGPPTAAGLEGGGSLPAPAADEAATAAGGPDATPSLAPSLGASTQAPTGGAPGGPVPRTAATAPRSVGAAGTASAGPAPAAGGQSGAAPTPGAPTPALPRPGESGVGPSPTAVPPGEERQGVTSSEILVGTVNSAGITPFPTAVQAPASYFKMLNDQGGINGRKFRYTVYEADGTDTNTALANVRKLNESDKFFAYVGGAQPLWDPIFTYMAQHGVPVVGTMSENSANYKEKNAFPTGSYVAVQCRDVVDYAVKKLGAKKVGTIYSSGAYVSADCGRGAIGGARLNGQEPEGTDSPLFPADYTQEVLRLRQAGVDFAVCAHQASGCVRMMQSAQRQGWRPEKGWGTCTPCYGSEIPKSMGEYASAGFHVGVGGHLWTSQNPGARRMVETMKKYARVSQLDGAAIPTWTGANLLADAVRAVGSDISRSRVMGWLAGQTAWRSEGDLLLPLDMTRGGGKAGWTKFPLSGSMIGKVGDGDLFEVDGQWWPDPFGGDPTPDRDS